MVQRLELAKVKDDTLALVDEFSTALEAVISKASRDLALALADEMQRNPTAFTASGTGPAELWDRLYRKPIENAWQVYAKDIMGLSGAAEFERLFGGGADVFNIKNPHALRFLNSRGAELVRGITDETRAGVRAIVKDMIEEGAGTEAVGGAVDAIGSLVGLSERDTNAVLRRAEVLSEKGYTDAQIARETQAMVDRALTRRGSTIARTEGMRAESEGIMTAWKQATDQQLLPVGARRKWIAEGPNVCHICTDLEALDPVGIEQPFYLLDVGPIWAPPAHPNCRCALGLVAPSGWT